VSDTATEVVRAIHSSADVQAIQPVQTVSDTVSADTVTASATARAGAAR
jgi:hypothetical protein